MITKTEIDLLVKKFEVEDFIKSDPIQFLHKFKKKEDIEIAGFMASLIAYGSRKVFIKKLDEFFEIANNKPHEFVLNFEPESLKGFYYRFGKDRDFMEIFRILRVLYEHDGGLETLFRHGWESGQLFQTVTDYFYGKVQSSAPHKYLESPLNPPFNKGGGTVGAGFYHMIPNPKNGGAMKRMCMFLRWMVRKGSVDAGIWDFMPASELLIPLDVHVARVSREMGLLARTSNDFKAVVELTENLKKFDPNDPVKYDFAMFGYGTN